MLGTTTWKEVLARFTSPVVIVFMVLAILNLLRNSFGWDIPVAFIEKLVNILIYGAGGMVAAINSPDNKHGL